MSMLSNECTDIECSHVRHAGGVLCQTCQSVMCHHVKFWKTAVILLGVQVGSEKLQLAPAGERSCWVISKSWASEQFVLILVVSI